MNWKENTVYMRTSKNQYAVKQNVYVKYLSVFTKNAFPYFLRL